MMTAAPQAAAVRVLACPQGDVHLVLTDEDGKPIAECALGLEAALSVGHKICQETIEAKMRELLHQDGMTLQ